MAGDCPHRSQLESALKHCQDQTSLIAANHESYITIIDELKTELDSLSCQVTMVQQEFNERDQAEEKSIETSLKELESQNDLLQQALEQAAQEEHKACTKLQENNENLKGQIEQLQCTICQKEQRITQLNAMLQHLQLEDERKPAVVECYGSTQAHHLQTEQELHCIGVKLEQANRKIESLLNELEQSQKKERFLLVETRKLNDELVESKRKNGDLTIQTRRLTSLLKSQEEHRLELAKKYESMEENYEDQAKKLRAANAQLNHLQERFVLMERRNDEHNMERNLLRDEVLALKEKEAVLLGKQKSMHEHLLKTQKELFTAHDVMKEQQCILQRNDVAHKELMKRSQEATNDLKRQFNIALDDYKRLEAEYEKELECRRKNEKVIESYRKWQESQIKVDEGTRNSFKQYEEHIKALLEEKQRFLEEYRNLHREYSILQNELGRLKMRQISTAVPVMNSSDKSIAQRMELLRSTSRRISEQNSSLRSDEASLATLQQVPKPSQDLG